RRRDGSGTASTRKRRPAFRSLPLPATGSDEPMAHKINTESRGGRTVYTLVEDESGASASILPSYGFNLFDLRLPAAGAVRRVVEAAADFPENPVKPARNGIPVLFPYPNRIKQGTFTFGGKSYSLPINSGAHSI